MEKNKEIVVVFVVGATGYPMLELMWRRHTHWTMFVAGGLCFLALYTMNTRCKKLKLWKKCALGAVIITSIEFMAGCVVNLLLEWDVWNYSRAPGNLLGQICPLYSLLWAALCLPISYLSDTLKAYLRRSAQENAVRAE